MPPQYTHRCGWTVQTGKKGVCYLHEASSLAFQTLGAAKVAMQAFRHMGHGDIPSDIQCAPEDDEDDEREEVLSIASCLDGVVVQLHKHMDTLHRYKELPQKNVESSWVERPKIVDMYDVCGYVHDNRTNMVLTQEDTLLQRSTKLRCHLLLATCAVYAQKLLHRSSYTSGYRQHCMYTLLQELRRSGPENPALAMLVEPLLPKDWRKELDRHKMLKDDEDTDLYATSVAEKDIQQAAEEEGSPLKDDFVVLEGPGMAKLSLKVKKISDALDLVPLNNRKGVENAVAHAVSQGTDTVMECCKAFEIKHGKDKFHQAWLCALKEAMADGADEEQGPG